MALWLSLVTFLFLGFAAKHLAGLIVGVIPMDLGGQSGHVSNQTCIYYIDQSAPGVDSTLFTCFATSSAAVSAPTWAHGAK
jgi:hypothetical protein